MLEAELTSQDLSELVHLTEELVKHCWKTIRFMDEFKILGAEEWRDKLDENMHQGFLQLSYDDAIKELEGTVNHSRNYLVAPGVLSLKFSGGDFSRFPWTSDRDPMFAS